MLSDRAALVAAVCANPAEDTPRLVFADWLQESGEPERAEFVRAQCALARAEDEYDGSYAMYEFLRRVYPTGLAATKWQRIDPGVKRLVDLQARCDKLLRKHGARWRPQGPGRRAKWGTFRRGFPYRVELRSARGLGALAAGLRGTVPPVELA
ncbi:MAG: TIGR02996 domain-containing protein, partial [Gemmata sp.]